MKQDHTQVIHEDMAQIAPRDGRSKPAQAGGVKHSSGIFHRNGFTVFYYTPPTEICITGRLIFYSYNERRTTDQHPSRIPQRSDCGKARAHRNSRTLGPVFKALPYSRIAQNLATGPAEAPPSPRRESGHFPAWRPHGFREIRDIPLQPSRFFVFE